jgi:hypothetical protein
MHARLCKHCAQPFVTDDGRRTACSETCAVATKRSGGAARQSKHRDKHLLRNLARQTLKNAILLGKIRRPDRCEACGELAKVEGHHEDYTRPFWVEWLCRECHAGLDDGRHFGAGEPKDATAEPYAQSVAR